MAAKRSKKYTVSDVYREAGRMLKEEIRSLKNKPLTPSEEIKMKELARVISNAVLKEMKIV